MPRPGPRRPLVNVRLTAEQIDALDALAAARQVTRSDVIRDAIEKALGALDAHMTHAGQKEGAALALRAAPDGA